MVTKNSIDSNIPIEASKGGTGNTSFTSQGILYYDGTKLTSTSSGSIGQVLTSNGAGSAPTFQNVPNSVSLVTVQQQFANDTSFIEFKDLPSYSTYIISISGYSPVLSGGSRYVNITVSTNNGSSYLGSGYQSSVTGFFSASSNIANISATGLIKLTNGTYAPYPNSFWLTLYNVKQGSPFYMTGISMFSDYTNGAGYGYIAANNSATNVNAIRIQHSGGSNISEGVFCLFGVKQ